MLANVFLKTTRERSTAMTVGALFVALMVLGGLAVYRTIDVEFYYQLPEVYLELLGLPEGGGVAGLGFGAVLNTIGALTLAGLAISMGSASIAGEEADGTIGLLLGNPVRRSRVLVSKAASLVVLSTAAAAIVWAGAAIAPGLLDIDTTGMHVGALIFHIFVNTVFYGLLAMAISASTGNRSTASGVTVAVMVAGWLAVGIFPLIESLDWLDNLFPWYYYAGSQPVVNGIHWGHMSVLAGASVVFTVVAHLGVNRRDLKGHGVKRSIVDRLRENPRTAKIAERFAGSVRVSGLVAKTASDHQGVMLGMVSIVFYLGLLFGVFWALLPTTIFEALEALPEALINAIGGADMSTAEGWFVGEMFSITAPIAIFVLTILMGTRALAGEEEGHTMGLLLASPVSRPRVLLAKAGTMVIYATLVGVATFLGSWIGGLIGDTGIGVAEFAAISLPLTLLGLVMGGVALLLSAATGRSRLAAYGASGIAVASYFAFAFFPVSESLAGWAKASPFYYYLGSDPLLNGFNWGHAGVLAGVFVALVALAIPLFQKRDLRG